MTGSLPLLFLYTFMVCCFSIWAPLTSPRRSKLGSGHCYVVTIWSASWVDIVFVVIEYQNKCRTISVKHIIVTLVSWIHKTRFKIPSECSIGSDSFIKDSHITLMLGECKVMKWFIFLYTKNIPWNRNIIIVVCVFFGVTYDRFFIY